MEFSQRIRREAMTTPVRSEATARIASDADWYETHGQGD